jgi:hypothetical protein
MAFWSRLADHYEHFTGRCLLSLPSKKESFEVLLLCMTKGVRTVIRSFGPREQVKAMARHVRRAGRTSSVRWSLSEK